MDLLVHDLRVTGRTPAGSGFRPITVDRNVTLERFFSVFRGMRRTHGRFGKMMIIAHGLTTGPNQNDPLGNGIQFCKEGINLGTVERFRELNGGVGLIELYCCGAAHIAPGREGRCGDGNLLCSRFAIATGSFVKASTEVQVSTTHWRYGALDMGEWEGLVMVYNPQGRVVENPTERHRSAWRDASGRWHGNGTN